MSIFNQDVFFWHLIDLLRSLTTETDVWKLRQKVISQCQDITRCDGASLYLLDEKETEQPHLDCVLIHNVSLDIHRTYGSDKESVLPAIPISAQDSETGEARSLAAYCAATGKTVCVENIYNSCEFNTQGVQAFDQLFNYRTRSVLSVPIMRSEGKLLGVIQLVNPQNPLCGTVARYTDRQIQIVEALAALLTVLR